MHLQVLVDVLQWTKFMLESHSLPLKTLIQYPGNPNSIYTILGIYNAILVSNIDRIA
jgi:hypothetical protein